MASPDVGRSGRNRVAGLGPGRDDVAMDVRQASVGDAVRIAEIHVRSWQQAYQGLISQEYLDSLDPAQRLERRIELLRMADGVRVACLVVTSEAGVIEGFSTIGPTRDDGEDRDRTGEVMAIYLAPDAWGKGLGRELMGASLRFLAGAGFRQATLWVLDTNERARRFYAAAGFVPDGAAKIDTIGGLQVREVRYRRPLQPAAAPEA